MKNINIKDIKKKFKLNCEILVNEEKENDGSNYGFIFSIPYKKNKYFYKIRNIFLSDDKGVKNFYFKRSLQRPLYKSFFVKILISKDIYVFDLYLMEEIKIECSNFSEFKSIEEDIKKVVEAIEESLAIIMNKKIVFEFKRLE